MGRDTSPRPVSVSSPSSLQSVLPQTRACTPSWGFVRTCWHKSTLRAHSHSQRLCTQAHAHLCTGTRVLAHALLHLRPRAHSHMCTHLCLCAHTDLPTIHGLVNLHTQPLSSPVISPHPSSWGWEVGPANEAAKGAGQSHVGTSPAVDRSGPRMERGWGYPKSWERGGEGRGCPSSAGTSSVCFWGCQQKAAGAEHTGPRRGMFHWGSPPALFAEGRPASVLVSVFCSQQLRVPGVGVGLWQGEGGICRHPVYLLLTLCHSSISRVETGHPLPSHPPGLPIQPALHHPLLPFPRSPLLDGTLVA